MATKPPPATPDAVGIASALEGSEALARLRMALKASQARYEAIRAVLPPELAPHVRPGPIDAEGWSLLAANAGIAAKLRHLKPIIEAALSDAGWVPASVRVKVISR
ncbi:MAG TPA: DciA family protein [Caldimonas sp.]|nr:DciA family protein [Caldimonas sp.]